MFKCKVYELSFDTKYSIQKRLWLIIVDSLKETFFMTQMKS